MNLVLYLLRESRHPDLRIKLIGSFAWVSLYMTKRNQFYWDRLTMVLLCKKSVKRFNRNGSKKDFLEIINLYSEAITFIGPGAAATDRMGSFGLRYVFNHS